MKPVHLSFHKEDLTMWLLLRTFAKEKYSVTVLKSLSKAISTNVYTNVQSNLSSPIINRAWEDMKNIGVRRGSN